MQAALSKQNSEYLRWPWNRLDRTPKIVENQGRRTSTPSCRQSIRFCFDNAVGCHRFLGAQLGELRLTHRRRLRDQLVHLLRVAAILRPQRLDLRHPALVGGRRLNIPGAGVFAEAKEMLRLTVPGENSSLWTVPSWLNCQVGLSYHLDPARWGRGTLQVVARGQEFVADINDNPDALAWLEELFHNTNPGLRPAYRFKSIGPSERPRSLRVWRYVVATDSGYAPCVHRRVLSLCICKPFIRLGAKVGDWVIGFMPKRFGPRIVWAGRVSEILPMGQYRTRFPRRPDAIYRLLKVTPDGREVLEHIGTGRHADQKSQETDQATFLVEKCFFALDLLIERDPPLR